MSSSEGTQERLRGEAVRMAGGQGVRVVGGEEVGMAGEEAVGMDEGGEGVKGITEGAVSVEEGSAGAGVKTGTNVVEGTSVVGRGPEKNFVAI